MLMPRPLDAFVTAILSFLSLAPCAITSKEQGVDWEEVVFDSLQNRTDPDDIKTFVWHQSAVIDEDAYWIGGFVWFRNNGSIEPNQFLWRQNLSAPKQLSRLKLPDYIPLQAQGQLFTDSRDLFLFTGANISNVNFTAEVVNATEDVNESDGISTYSQPMNSIPNIWRIIVSEANPDTRWENLTSQNQMTTLPSAATTGVFVPDTMNAYIMGGQYQIYGPTLADGLDNPSVDLGNGSDLLVFDVSQKSWTNTSAEGVDRMRLPAILEYLPYGSKGILIAIAGFEGDPNVGGDPIPEAFPFDSVDIYDIGSSKWYTQGTTGTTPGLIPTGTCSVVASQEDHSSHEIFIIGSDKNTLTLQVWVLSVPSFQWFTPSSRILPDDFPGEQFVGFSCSLAGNSWGSFIGGMPKVNWTSVPNASSDEYLGEPEGFLENDGYLWDLSTLGSTLTFEPGPVGPEGSFNKSYVPSNLLSAVKGRSSPIGGFNSADLERIFSTNSTNSQENEKNKTNDRGTSRKVNLIAPLVGSLVPAAVIACVLVGFWHWKRIRRFGEKSKTVTAFKSSGMQGPKELAPNEVRGEIDGGILHEAEGDSTQNHRVSNELEGDLAARHELL